jgi:LysM repeat protein
LQLLDDRTREVDALVQDAKEQAREITYDAEKRAEEITAEAERQRTELEEQVAVLRGEVAQIREELAQLRAAQPPQQGGRGGKAPAAAGAVAAEAIVSSTEAGIASASDAATVTEVESAPFGPTLRDPVAAADAAEAAEAAGTPRWGRPSSIASAQQAIRSRSARPRWLPRWLPFVILLLAGAGAVTASVSGQGNGRTTGEQSSPGVITVTEALTTPTRAPELAIAAATSIATSLVAVGAASTAGQTSQPTTPGRPPALATFTRGALIGSAPTGASMATDTATPRLAQTIATTRLPAASVQPAPLVTPSAALPYDVSPEGPIVAAYTTYATYSVRPGDTLNRVATDFGVASEIIMRASALTDPNLLLPGQVLTIPRETGWLYRVQSSDTLETIALRFAISPSDLIAASGLTTLILKPGDLLFIPNRALPGMKQ